MTLRAAALVAASAILAAAPSPALADDQVRVTFAAGRVSIAAENATLAEILREWSRAGGSHFVNLERIPPGQPVTLRLEDESELRALEVLLRPLAGYAATPRTPDANAPSSLDTIVLLAQPSRPMVYGLGASPRPGATSPSPRDIAAEFRRRQRDVMSGSAVRDQDGAARRTRPPVQDEQPNPLQGLPTQAIPGIGVVTSQPGAVIPTTTTKPRPGGGGG